jgi:hypothetical protein
MICPITQMLYVLLWINHTMERANKFGLFMLMSSPRPLPAWRRGGADRSKSLLTKWPERSKGNYSTMMHSFSEEDSITVQHVECKLFHRHSRHATQPSQPTPLFYCRKRPKDMSGIRAVYAQQE